MKITKTMRRHVRLLERRLAAGRPLRMGDPQLLTAMERLQQGKSSPHDLKTVPVPPAIAALSAAALAQRLAACAPLVADTRAAHARQVLQNGISPAGRGEVTGR